MPHLRPGTSLGSPRPRTARSETCGLVHRIVRWLDANKGAFFVSRLILHTGFKLRAYDAHTADDPEILERLWPSLDKLLTPDERVALVTSLREPV